MSSQIPAATFKVSLGGAFDLGDQAAYAHWRKAKLDRYPASIEELIVRIDDLAHPSDAEISALLERCDKANMAIYRANKASLRDDVISLGKRLGLQRLDANLSADEDRLTAIEVLDNRPGNDYVPHTDRPLRWHTDGYYNLVNQKVRAMVLHCVRPADKGGANTLVDPEMVYIQLRDRNPAHIAAISKLNAMTIPANIENGHEIRPARTGPVFSIDIETGALHIRYTARTRSIEWRDDAATAAAIKTLEEILVTPWPWTFRYRLAAGEGIVCNNVLHKREGFHDSASGPGRLMLRGRYYDRIRSPKFRKEAE